MRRKLDFLIGVPLLIIIRLFSGKRETAISPPPQRILLIKLAAFGDGVVLIPMIRALRQAHPAAEIDWLATRVISPMATLVPYVNNVRVLRSFAPWTILQECLALRKNRYDLVIDFEQWSRGSALIAWATGAPVRLGYSVAGQHRDSLFTHTLEKRFAQHERDDFFALAELAVKLDGSRTLELWETQEGVEEVRALVPEVLNSSRIATVILLHPGCGADGLPREWPIYAYAQFAQHQNVRRRITWIITGGPDDAAKAKDLSTRIPGSINLAGRLSWNGVLSLVKRADLLVSGNTGIMHVAAAWRIPQIAIHGPTDHRIWGPLSNRAIVIQSNCPECPCLRLGFEYHRYDQSCMARIQVAEVTEAARTLLP